MMLLSCTAVVPDIGRYCRNCSIFASTLHSAPGL
jgi:hypothetical protein